jgi:hypothetical protein
VVSAAETWSFYHDNYLYILDQKGQRLLRINPWSAGAVQAQTTARALPEPDTPAAWAWMDLDYYENLWVTDPARSCVHKFDRHLNYLTSFGSPGTGDGRFTRPTGIAVYRHFGQVFVAEANGAHYFWIGADVQHASVSWQSREGRCLALRFTLTEPAHLIVRAQTADGRRTQIVSDEAWMDSGPQCLLWRLPADWPAAVHFQFTAEATYSSASYFSRQLDLDWKDQGLEPLVRREQ